MCVFYLFFFAIKCTFIVFFFFSSRRRHTRYWRDWSSDVCSSDLIASVERVAAEDPFAQTSWARAVILALGAAAYGLGNALFRRTLVLGGVRPRAWTGVAALATAPLGAWLAPTAQMAALVVVFLAGFAAERGRPAQVVTVP